MPVVHRRHVRQPAAGHCLQKLRGWDVQYGLLHVNLPTVRERYVRQPAGGHGLPELRGWDVHSVAPAKHSLPAVRGGGVQYGIIVGGVRRVREWHVRQPAGGHGLPELRGWDVHSVTYNGASLTFRSQPWAIELMIARAPIAAAENATITAENGNVINAKVFYSFKRTR